MTDKKPPLVYQIVRFVFSILFRLLTKLDMQGLERIPLHGPALLTVNHTSIFEAPLVLTFSPRQPISAMAKREYKGTFPTGSILNVVDPIYVNRGEVDRQALKEMVKRLKAGGAIGIAPEGTRSPHGKLIEAKEGTAYLALQTDAWIVPIAVWGNENIISEWKRLRRAAVHLRVGEPFKLESDPTKERKENLEIGTKRIMHAIAALLPPDYHGFYATAIEGPTEKVQSK